MFEVRSRNQIRASGCLEQLRSSSHQDRSVGGITTTCPGTSAWLPHRRGDHRYQLMWEKCAAPLTLCRGFTSWYIFKPSFVPDLSRLIPDTGLNNHIRCMNLSPNVSASPISPWRSSAFVAFNVNLWGQERCRRAQILITCLPRAFQLTSRLLHKWFLRLWQ